MNGLAERKPKEREPQVLEYIMDYIKGVCDQSQTAGLGGGHAGRKIFADDIDYFELAKYVSEENADGPSLKTGEITSAIVEAIAEKEPDRKKGGLSSGFVTTNHILFQFYLVKRALRPLT